MARGTPEHAWYTHREDGVPLPPLTANFQEAAETYNFFSSETYS